MNDLQRRKYIKELYNRTALLIMAQEQNGRITSEESRELLSLLEEKCSEPKKKD